MFHNAVSAIFPYVMPILLARRLADGKAECLVLGAGVVVSADGWFVTAGHIVAELALAAAEAGGKARRRGQRSGRARVTHFVPLFGSSSTSLETDMFAQMPTDIGFGKLKNYRPPITGSGFPKLRKNPPQQGEILCRVGFPFTNDIPTKWTKEKGFDLTNPFPVPVFVNEAMVSRFAELPDGAKWIETSSPGLRGQSGGPLIDVNGLVCGIQINTHHYDLGFARAGRNQVLNVGRAVHPDTILAAAREQGIHVPTS